MSEINIDNVNKLSGLILDDMNKHMEGMSLNPGEGVVASTMLLTTITTSNFIAATNKKTGKLVNREDCEMLVDFTIEDFRRLTSDVIDRMIEDGIIRK